jgi:hypothetical protein
VESTVIVNTLFLVAAILLVTVSGGMVYLTTLEWRDRRRESTDKKMGK